MPWESLHQTVLTLAASVEPLKDRLKDAHLNLMSIKPDKLPPYVQEDYDAIMDQLDGLNSMANDEAKEVIEMIVHIYDAVAREKEPL